MSCSVAIASSPVFSPETSLYHFSDASPSSSCGSASPFRSLHFHRAASGLRPIAAAAASSPSPTGPAACGSVLKRKRPARIDIPLMEPPAIQPDGGQSKVEVEREGYSVYCKRGKRRVEMEDRYGADTDLLGDSQMSFFGIFDGHSGAKASDFAANNIGKFIADELKRGGDEGVCGLEEAVRSGYMKTDAEFLKEGAAGGTCCVTAIVSKGDLVVSNAGDCRAVLSRAGTAEALTSDHKPSREDERDRIEKLGGYVDYCRGVWRLQGSLAVSRGIGDLHLKQWVVPEPETKVVRIEPECEFLILASDGLWDKVSNQEAVDVARPLCMAPEKQSPLSACRELVELSASRGSVDDISVMIIKLSHFS